MMGVGMKIKKVVIFPLKRCYRSICNHLVLVGFVFFLLFLYRWVPFIFPMLVSVSPVVVCTFVLLGALLSFGKPNVPEVEVDSREAHEVVLLKAAFSDDSGAEKNDSVRDKGKVVEEKSNEGSSEIVNDINSGKMVEQISRESDLDERVEGKKGFRGFKMKKTRKMLDRRFKDNQYSLITEDNNIDDDEHINEENSESVDCSADSKDVNVDNSDEEQGDEVLDSSPDASIADITPILDELHPLLDEEASQPPNLSHEGSDGYSELSVTPNDSSSELEDDLEDDSDDDEELDVVEEVNEDKEGETKCAITWTEEDQKNLMDLGTSELERNKRLENLIARRSARRCMTTVTEKDLIDLDIPDPTFRVPPISTSTTKTNPFDSSQGGSNEDTGPGSAPSVLLPLKNPFDIHFDSIHKKTDREFMPPQSKDPFIRRHDSFNVQLSSSPLQSKDPFFRRHESFNVQPSYLGMDGTEKQVMGRYRPYFVSERLGSVETSFLPIHRQPSDVSDSKTSSVADTEDEVSSTGNVEEEEEEEEEEGSFIDAEDDISREPKLISKIDEASELIGHGSESSEEEEEEESIELGGVEKRQIKVDELDMKLEKETSIKAENQLEIGSGEIHQNVESHSNNATPPTIETTHKEPVYDLSPRAAFENRSMSSITFDPQVDSAFDSSAIVVKRAVSFSERVKHIGSSDVDKVTPGNSSKKPPVDKTGRTSEPSVSHGEVTNEDRSAVDIQNVDTFEDVGSDQGESNVKGPMQNAPEGISNKKEKSSNKSSSSSSSSSPSAYASLSDSEKG